MLVRSTTVGQVSGRAVDESEGGCLSVVEGVEEGAVDGTGIGGVGNAEGDAELSVGADTADDPAG